MLKIALIDDMEYGIMQVKNSIPEGVEYDFFYFDTFEKSVGQSFDIALIDFYLDKDGVTGDTIIPFVEAKIKIGFSSVPACSKKILDAGADYSCTKLNDTKNSELEYIFLLILS